MNVASTANGGPLLALCALVLVLPWGACTTTVTGDLKPDFQIETSVDGLSATQAPSAAPVTGLVPSGGLVDDPMFEPQEPGDREARLRSRFGSSILIKPDGRVTKQYFFSDETGGVLLKLLKEPGGAEPKPRQVFATGGGDDSQSMLGRMLGGHRIEVLYIQGFEVPEGVAIRSVVTTTAQRPSAGPPNNLALITAEPAGLSAFEGAINLFFANIPQIEIEVKVVEYTTTDSLAIGIDQVDTDTPTLDNLNSGQLVDNIISQFPLRTPLAGPASAGSLGTIFLGGIHDSWALNAQLQLLEARGVADVLSSPKMVVRNGGTASVTTRTDLPYPQAKITSSGQNIEANIVFKPVGIVLNIRPVIAGTQTVILQVYANVAAVTDFAATEPVATPIISSREVLTTVHVADGKTTVIGGLVTRSNLTTETKLPILGDIPVLGYLFRSISESTQRTTLQFHITPRLIQGPRGFQGAEGGG